MSLSIELGLVDGKWVAHESVFGLEENEVVILGVQFEMIGYVIGPPRQPGGEDRIWMLGASPVSSGMMDPAEAEDGEWLEADSLVELLSQVGSPQNGLSEFIDKYLVRESDRQPRWGGDGMGDAVEIMTRLSVLAGLPEAAFWDED